MSVVRVREMMERIWKVYEPRFAGQGYELVVLAVPTEPGNIEAVAARDLSTVGDLLAGFIQRKGDDEQTTTDGTEEADEGRDDAAEVG
jgi:hypothetical protein